MIPGIDAKDKASYSLKVFGQQKSQLERQLSYQFSDDETEAVMNVHAPPMVAKAPVVVKPTPVHVKEVKTSPPSTSKNSQKTPGKPSKSPTPRTSQSPAFQQNPRPNQDIPVQILPPVPAAAPIPQEDPKQT